MITPGHPKERVAECYELLRQEALVRPPVLQRGHGLALFLRRGMPGWLEVWQAFEPSPPAREEGAEGQPPIELPVGSRWEVATIMAQMILACAGEPA